jgi:hypothetical protein
VCQATSAPPPGRPKAIPEVTNGRCYAVRDMRVVVMEPPRGLARLIFLDQTGVKRRCVERLAALRARSNEPGYAAELARVLDEVVEQVRPLRFAARQSPATLRQLLGTQLSVGNHAAVPFLFASAIPDRRARPAAFVAGGIAIAAPFALTSKHVPWLRIAAILVGGGIALLGAMVLAITAWAVRVGRRNPHLGEALRLDEAVRAQPASDPARAAYRQLRALADAHPHELRVQRLRAAAALALLQPSTGGLEPARELIDDARAWSAAGATERAIDEALMVLDAIARLAERSDPALADAARGELDALRARSPRHARRHQRHFDKWRR